MQIYRVISFQDDLFFPVVFYLSSVFDSAFVISCGFV